MKTLATVLTLAALATAALHAETYEERMGALRKDLQAAQKGGEKEFFGVLEKSGQALIKDFPDKPDGYQMLLAVIEQGGGSNGKELLKLLEAEKAPAEVKAQAKAIAAKLEQVGKPFDLKFTAVDGREVDIQAMKGKVVLIDFWATWCGPCVAELPTVKAAYDKLNPKGFEIVGISFDDDKAKLEGFVKDKSMAWPQYFDGKAWESALGKKYGITGIPTMWLVDKKGNLVDLSARSELTAKVEKLLAE